jgi:hypothetical protein
MRDGARDISISAASSSYLVSLSGIEKVTAPQHYDHRHTIIAMVRLLLRTVVLAASLAIGVLVASVLARHTGVGIGGRRGRVRAADGHKSVGSSQ